MNNNPCVDCGQIDIRTLEFDHVKGKKIRTISEMLGENYSIDTVRKEIAKCNIRCANCHKIKTATERNYWINKFIDT